MANPSYKETKEPKMGEIVGDKPEQNETTPMEKGRDTVSKVIGSVGPVFKEGYEQAEHAVQTTLDSAETAIKKYPMQAMLIGLGAGALLGLTLRGLFSNDSNA